MIGPYLSSNLKFSRGWIVFCCTPVMEDHILAYVLSTLACQGRVSACKDCTTIYPRPVH